MFFIEFYLLGINFLFMKGVILMKQQLIKTTDLCDEFSEQLQICSLQWKSFGRNSFFHGPIYTVDVLNDNTHVRSSLEEIPAGAVLVVDGRNSDRCALLGDNLAMIAQNRGIVGIIVNGRVRDSRDLQSISVGVFALGTHPKKSVKQGKGQKNITLQFGNVDWIPGDYVYADEDGIVVAKKPLHVE